MIVSPIFLGCSSSIKFDAVRSSSNPTVAPRRAGRRKPSDSSFSSWLLLSRGREIWCQSSREFERLRPFPIIYRNLAIICPISIVKKFTRVRATSPEFDRLPCCANGLATPHRLGRTLKTNNEQTRIAQRLTSTPELSVLNSFQDVKDNLS